MTRKPRLVLLGKQGAGKGTQANQLAEHYAVPHFSTGDLFRAAAKAGTPAGLAAQGYMNDGNLVPDDVVIGVVEEQFASGAFETGFVLDGFPRTETQAAELDRVLDGRPLDLVLTLDVPTEIALERLAGRRVCEDCGAVYHVDHPPKEDWTCDVCGGKVVQREDDTEAAIMRRLELYEREMLPIVQYYRRQRRLAVVYGVGEQDEVAARLATAIDGRIAAELERRDRGVITKKSREQIALMRRAGKVVAEMHEECIRASKPGATTLDVDRVAREVLDRRGARSNFLNYHGFPAVVCTSPNQVIVHGIPDATVLAEGDIFSIDCGAIIEGWHADAAVTVPIGDVDDESARLIEATRRSLEAAIEQVVAGRRLGDVGAAVQGLAEAEGFSVVREYVGHGIGTAMHEEPQVPNYAGGPNAKYRLREGLVLAIEPMVNAGTAETLTLEDGWTVVTRDGRRSAHFEHTIAVTEHGPEVLTLPG